MNEPILTGLRKSLPSHYDSPARRVRAACDRHGVFLINVLSGPRAGKTTLMQHVLAMLEPSYDVAALVADVATAVDADYLRNSGVAVRPVVTTSGCHLEAAMVESAIDGWTLPHLDLLFIENVGNLVCPATCDLGENLRIVLMTAGDGEDTPMKYPTIFSTADVVVITKMDIAATVDFDEDEARRQVRAVQPDARVFGVSARTGRGMNAFVAYLEACQRRRAGVSVEQVSGDGGRRRDRTGGLRVANAALSQLS